MERERIVLEGRAKAAARGAAAERAGQGASQELARERDRLREELETVKHERLMGEAQGVETLRLRNKLLQVRTGKSLIDACKQLSSVCRRRGWRLRKRR